MVPNDVSLQEPFNQLKNGDIQSMPSDEHFELDYAFLKHDIEHLCSYHLMFIIRGAPGTGKTTLARTIAKTYPDCVTVSSDDFPGYYDNQDTYQWTREKSEESHAWCEEKARTACETKRRCVIIDKTNVKRESVTFYTELAKQQGYRVIAVTAKCHRRAKADELCRRTHHDVPAERISGEYLEAYEELIPKYFAWFFNEAESRDLLQLGNAALHECFKKVESFRNMLRNVSDVTASDSSSLIGHYYTREYFSFNHLHCTAKFCSDASGDECSQYVGSVVPDVVGRIFALSVVSVVISPKSVGVRVALTSEQLALWDNDVDGCHGLCSRLGDNCTHGECNDRQSELRNEMETLKVHHADFTQKSSVGNPETVEDIKSKSDCLPTEKGKSALNTETTCGLNQNQISYTCDENSETKATSTTPEVESPSASATYDEICQAVDKCSFCSGVLKRGDKAHITLYLAEGVSPVQTGPDQLEALKRARSCLPCYEGELDCGIAKCYDGGYLVIDLNKRINVRGLFTGYY